MAGAYLSADDILSADDLGAEDVEVPEWGGAVRVQGLTGAERDKFEAAFAVAGKGSARGYEMVRARLAAACIVDAEGNRLFRGDATIRRLGEKSAAALDRVFEVACRLSGLSEDDTAELAGN